ncbi:MAG: mitochondrial fission ELM1 family protein [Gammaproteobacteria bacterium]|nr:mitochondrial fission ELM1 family protein [Gammaproteobacteria bacterium]
MALRVLRVSDGKRGHDNQSIGLLEALARRSQIQVMTLPLVPASRTHVLRVAGRIALGADTPLLAGMGAGADTHGRLAELSPQLVVGAGKRCHWPLLAAARRYRARGIVLMNPGPYRRLFDLCIVPRHDGVGPAPGILHTDGAINRIRPCPSARRDDHALVLLGGPASGLRWNDAHIVQQVRRLVASGGCWTVASSRRTPPTVLAQLADSAAKLVPFDSVDGNWLPRMLPRFATIWVSEDSASMLYEALSAGAATGVLEVAGAARRGWVSSGVHELRERGLLVTYGDWSRGRAPHAPAVPLAEADRCAQWLLSEWLHAA